MITAGNAVRLKDGSVALVLNEGLKGIRVQVPGEPECRSVVTRWEPVFPANLKDLLRFAVERCGPGYLKRPRWAAVLRSAGQEAIAFYLPAILWEPGQDVPLGWLECRGIAPDDSEGAHLRLIEQGGSVSLAELEMVHMLRPVLRPDEEILEEIDVREPIILRHREARFGIIEA